jgi:K+-sensing histidine kinase KdpD
VFVSGPIFWVVIDQNITNWLWPLVFSAAITSLPVAAGIAMLKYRLYDIDVIINRTLVYGALTLMLALVYFGLVVVLQGLVRTFAANAHSELVTVVSTLSIAALFQPLRIRIQHMIDRRFYRRKYDAATTLQAFSARLRDEVDIQTMSQEMVTVIQETLQPTTVSLWLRPGSEIHSVKGS